MASLGEPLRRSPFPAEGRSYQPPPTRTLPILPSAVAAPQLGNAEPMDVSQPQSQTTSMGPPLLSPNVERLGDQASGGQNQSEGMGMRNGQSPYHAPPTGAAAAAQQPKVVQTAFIHKLYK
jgi:hypothetical protein